MSISGLAQLRRVGLSRHLGSLERALQILLGNCQGWEFGLLASPIGSAHLSSPSQYLAHASQQFQSGLGPLISSQPASGDSKPAGSGKVLLSVTFCDRSSTMTVAGKRSTSSRNTLEAEQLALRENLCISTRGETDLELSATPAGGPTTIFCGP